MRIPCPFCGLRDLHEFAYLGDATLVRPDSNDAQAQALFAEYMYLRENPAGWHQELWYHASGCRCWIKVRRDTRTHEIEGAQMARIVT